MSAAVGKVVVLAGLLDARADGIAFSRGQGDERDNRNADQKTFRQLNSAGLCIDQKLNGHLTTPFALDRHQRTGNALA